MGGQWQFQQAGALDEPGPRTLVFQVEAVALGPVDPADVLPEGQFCEKNNHHTKEA